MISAQQAQKALLILDQAASQAPLNRQTTAQVIEAAKALHQFINEHSTEEKQPPKVAPDAKPNV